MEQLPFLLKFLIVFVAVYLGDMCWAKYMIWAAEKHPHKAAIWGTLILIFGQITLFGYMEDRRLTLAAILGAYLGTFFTVRGARNQSGNKNN